MTARHVAPSQFFDFIAQPVPVVVLVQVSPLQRFNESLPKVLRSAHQSEVSCGYVTLIELLFLDDSIVHFLQLGLQTCEGWRSRHPMPGYYLFRAGEMLAWDSGLPARPDLERIIGASVLGLVGYALTRNVALLGIAARTGAREATAARLAARFHRLAQEHHAGTRPRSQTQRNPAAELLEAYRLLGLFPDATDEEVEAAWRRMRAENHPDRAAGDPAEFARRTQISLALNQARDRIRQDRDRGRWRTAGGPTAA